MQFFKDSIANPLGIQKVPENVTNEGEWFGPVANTLVTIVTFCRFMGIANA